MGKGADLTLLDCFQRTKNEDGEFNEMASLKVTRIIISFQKYSFIEVCSVVIVATSSDVGVSLLFFLLQVLLTHERLERRLPGEQVRADRREP